MKSFLNLSVAILLTVTLNAQVGIGTTNPQGALDITSTTNGLIIPRVALVNTATVTVDTPIASELVYNTTFASGTTDVSPGFYYLSAIGGPWVRLGETSSSPPPPPPPPVSVGWELTGNTVTAGDFIGSTNAADVEFKRNNFAAGKLGASNTSFGLAAGEDIVGGEENTAIGVNALKNNVGADDNTAIGYNTLQASSGIGNTAVGHLASRDNTSGTYNTGVGVQSLLLVSEGDHNIGIGFQAGQFIATGDNNVVIGNSAGSAIANGNNNIAIGFNAQVDFNTGNNQVQIGNNSITDAKCAVAWALGSDIRLKESIEDSALGLDFLQTIRPVSYIRKNDNRKRTEYGFIAQELEQALNNAGDKNNAVVNVSDAGMYSVRYNDFISITVKAVQEQQVLIETLQKQNTELMKSNAAILKRLEALENKN